MQISSTSISSVLTTQKRMRWCSTPCSHLFTSWCKDPFTDLISTLSPSSLLVHREAWPSICQFLHQHSHIDPHLQLAHSTIWKFSMLLHCLLTCYPTYLGGFHTNTCKDILLSSKLAVPPAEHNQEAKLKPFFFSFHFSLFSKSLLLCSQVWVLWIS